ncbi:MAG: penicillin-binding protein 2 [Actinomyces sp.]|nr:MAG: penicillin-binding protein 2 [Actinomyces sp.]
MTGTLHRRGATRRSGGSRRPSTATRRPRVRRAGIRPSTRSGVTVLRPEVGRVRTVVGIAAVVAVFGGLAYRLGDLQIDPDPRLVTEVAVPVPEIRIPAPRGDILDRLGRPLATSVTASTVVADRRLVVDPGATAARLAPVLGLEVAAVADRLTGDGAFAYVARQISEDTAAAVAELDLPGIDLITEPTRDHPNGDCTALAVIGDVNPDHVGRSGLELTEDERLAGTPGRVVKEMSANRSLTIPGGIREIERAVPGSDLQTTLDRNIQFTAEQLLAEAVAGADAARGVALVGLPATGEVLAMANVARGDDGTVACTTRNLAATWTYEPGSVLKPLTLSGVFEEGRWGPRQPLEVPPSIERWGHVFRDEPWHETEELTPAEIVARSSNVGTITLVEQLEPAELESRLRDFGLGAPSPLRLPYESGGILLDAEHWNGLTRPNVAIGQGVAVTPVQLLDAYGAIANGGLLVPPTLAVDQIATTGRRVVDETTAATLLDMLAGVVDHGTGRAAALDGYRVAGKTGTAWQPCEGGEGYECPDGGRHYTATFAAIVSDARGPVLTVVVVIDDPRGEEVSGGHIAAPVVADLAGYALRQLRIPPSDVGDPSATPVRALPAVAGADPVESTS